ncbi:nitrogenase component 1, partial [Methanoregula sp.]|uniref:nitrogenase component 1 n=1 Tax=Methanoregula sp. TaxID=2052170 RepID=UPI000CC51B7C
LDATREVFSALCDHIDNLDITPLETEVRKAGERLVRACDKYLQRYDPPAAVIFGTSAYAGFAAESLVRYLDADIAAIGTRTEPAPGRFPAEKVTGFSRAREIVGQHTPDLIIGSSFERTLSPDAAFVGLTPPLRGQVRLHANPICGTEGTLSFMESVLNVCIDRVRHT